MFQDSVQERTRGVDLHRPDHSPLLLYEYIIDYVRYSELKEKLTVPVGTYLLVINNNRINVWYDINETYCICYI